MGKNAKNASLCSAAQAAGRSTSQVAFVLLNTSPQSRHRRRLGTWPGAPSGDH